MTDRLTAGATIVLDENGAGSAHLGPGRQAERWTVERYSTNGSSTVEPELQVFRGSGMIDTTKRGNSDISEVTAPLTLWGGESLVFTYSGGTAGAVMTVYVEGQLDHGQATS